MRGAYADRVLVSAVAVVPCPFVVMESSSRMVSDGQRVTARLVQWRTGTKRCKPRKGRELVAGEQARSGGRGQQLKGPPAVQVGAEPSECEQ